MTATLPSEACHWYTKQGAPCYEVTAKNGKMRPTTLADARKLDLVPSVTTIINAAAKPGLQKWKLQQTLLAALTLPRVVGESIEAFAERVILDSEEQGKKAAERGTELHAAIELWMSNQDYDIKFTGHIFALDDTLTQFGINLMLGKSEHSFASPLGYGGKIDWHNDDGLIDFKTKDKIIEGKQLAWPEHCWQLAAYDVGIGDILSPMRRRINVFIGVEDLKVRIHEWTQDDAAIGWKAFWHLLEFWKITKQF